jgi:hypothetical protein
MVRAGSLVRPGSLAISVAGNLDFLECTNWFIPRVYVALKAADQGKTSSAAISAASSSAKFELW